MKAPRISPATMKRLWMDSLGLVAGLLGWVFTDDVKVECLTLRKSDHKTEGPPGRADRRRSPERAELAGKIWTAENLTY
jgi:hypothetical protein